jgi:DNA polymerase-3 subunit alpha
VQFDRFSGALRLNAQNIIDLPTARYRFGKHLLVQMGPLAAHEPGPSFSRVFSDHPPQRATTDSGDVLMRGLPVRVRLGIRSNDGSIVEGTLALNEDCQFYPSDAALASWTALLPQGQVHVVYSGS